MAVVALAAARIRRMVCVRGKRCFLGELLVTLQTSCIPNRVSGQLIVWIAAVHAVATRTRKLALDKARGTRHPAKLASAAAVRSVSPIATHHHRALWRRLKRTELKQIIPRSKLRTMDCKLSVVVLEMRMTRAADLR